MSKKEIERWQRTGKTFSFTADFAGMMKHINSKMDEIAERDQPTESSDAVEALLEYLTKNKCPMCSQVIK